MLMATEKLIEDVRSAVLAKIEEARALILCDAATKTPKQLVDSAIAATLNVCENQFQLISEYFCEPNGCPVQVDGLVQAYWELVSDENRKDTELPKAE